MYHINIWLGITQRC